MSHKITYFNDAELRTGDTTCIRAGCFHTEQSHYISGVCCVTTCDCRLFIADRKTIDEASEWRPAVRELATATEKDLEAMGGRVSTLESERERLFASVEAHAEALAGLASTVAELCEKAAVESPAGESVPPTDPGPSLRWLREASADFAALEKDRDAQHAALLMALDESARLREELAQRDKRIAALEGSAAERNRAEAEVRELRAKLERRHSLGCESIQHVNLDQPCTCDAVEATAEAEVRRMRTVVEAARAHVADCGCKLESYKDLKDALWGLDGGAQDTESGAA